MIAKMKRSSMPVDEETDEMADFTLASSSDVGLAALNCVQLCPMLFRLADHLYNCQLIFLGRYWGHKQGIK